MFESGVEHGNHRKTSSIGGGGGTKPKVSVASSFDEQVEERRQSMERGSIARCAPPPPIVFLSLRCVTPLLLYVSKVQYLQSAWYMYTVFWECDCVSQTQPNVQFYKNTAQ